jgi:hypothetical protein
MVVVADAEAALAVEGLAAVSRMMYRVPRTTGDTCKWDRASSKQDDLS